MSANDFCGYVVAGTLFLFAVGFAGIIMWALYKSVKEW
jgi:hypothetical protein